jgi:hypothetical protein
MDDVHIKVVVSCQVHMSSQFSALQSRQVSIKLASVQFSAVKVREEVSEQWCCCEVMREQRKDLKSMNGCRQEDSNCSMN